MKFLLDNNLPPALARALHELSKADGHQVTALREKFKANTPDIEWISQLRAEGNWVVVSKDKFSKGSMEKRAFSESGLAILFSQNNGTRHLSGIPRTIWCAGGQLLPNRRSASLAAACSRLAGDSAYPASLK